jgi:hypothetical protein
MSQEKHIFYSSKSNIAFKKELKALFDKSILENTRNIQGEFTSEYEFKIWKKWGILAARWAPPYKTLVGKIYTKNGLTKVELKIKISPILYIALIFFPIAAIKGAHELIISSAYKHDKTLFPTLILFSGFLTAVPLYELLTKKKYINKFAKKFNLKKLANDK